jgi:hypothetical protein
MATVRIFALFQTKKDMSHMHLHILLLTSYGKGLEVKHQWRT